MENFYLTFLQASTEVFEKKITFLLVYQNHPHNRGAPFVTTYKWYINPLLDNKQTLGRHKLEALLELQLIQKANEEDK